MDLPLALRHSSMLLPSRPPLRCRRQHMAALLTAGLEDSAAALSELAGAEARGPSPLPAWCMTEVKLLEERPGKR